MVELILFFSSILGFFSFLTLTLKRNALDVLFYYASAVVLTLYIFSIFGLLKFGVIFICAIGISLLIYESKQICNSLKYIKPLSYLSVLLFLFPFIYIFIIIDDSFVFTGWDEFSFWGSSIKLIYLENSIYTESTPLSAFKNYPPAQQLWQYNTLFFTGWSEKYVLVSQSFFILSCLLFSVSRLIKNNNIISFFVFLSIIPIMYYFGYGLSNIYVDQLLAVYLAATMSLASTTKNKTDIIFLCISVMVLVLIKQVGLVFSLFIIIYYIVFNLFNNKECRCGFKKQLIIASVLLASVFVIYKTWSFYVSSINYPSNVKIPSLMEMASESFKYKYSETINEFTNRFFNFNFVNGWSSSLHLSMFQTFIFLYVMSFFQLFFVVKRNILKSFIVNTYVLSFGVMYIIFLIFCYVAFFTEYESLRLASFERYAATFFIAWSLIIYIGTIQSISERSQTIAIILSILLLLFTYALSPSSYKDDIKNITFDKSRDTVISKISESTLIIKALIKDNERAYIIDQNSNGYSAVAFNYYMLPSKPFSWCWSLGNKYNEHDQWTCDKTLRDVLHGISYLYIYNADNQFWDKNAKFFNGRHKNDGNGVYRVKWEGNELIVTPI